MRRFVSLLAVAAVTTFPSAQPVRAASRVILTPPVEAPVLDPFRAPASPYGPGNRGIEYATSPGTRVRAAAGGVVVFAGAVARSLHVTIDHGGGLLSSYSFLDRELVSVGDLVSRGDLIGVTGSTFHFGVRLHGVYVDPASLMGTRVVEVRLVPKRGVRAATRTRVPLAIPAPRSPVGNATIGAQASGTGHPLGVG